MKIIINSRFGGLSFSDEVFEQLIKKGWRVTEPEARLDYVAYQIILLNYRGIKYKFNCYRSGADDWTRTNAEIIEVVESLGCERASGVYAALKIIEIPDNISWYISEYDGVEEVHETHRSWD